MRIMVVSHSSVVGTYRGKLREWVEQSDVDVDLVVPPAWPENNQWVTAEAEASSPYRFTIVPAYRLGRVASYFFHPLVFLKTVRHVRPDIVYAEEEPWSLAAWQSMHAARSVNARFMFFTWENLLRRYKWVSRKILRSVMDGANAAVAGNSDAVRVLTGRGFAKPIKHLPQYGIDLSDSNGKASVPIAGIERLPRPRIAFVGRLEKEKGVHVLLRAAAGLKGQWSLIILGNGEERNPLYMSVREIGIEDRVVFLDGIPHRDVPGVMAGVDILVLPSITTDTWKEQFGRVLVEGMAAGVSVVGSDSGAIPEVVDDAGIVFPEGDSSALRTVLQRLIDSDETRRSYSLRGKVRAEQYGNRRIAGEYYSFFRQVAGER